MALRPLLTSIIGWLRAGYPAGAPERGYIPLFALLSSQLTEADVATIADLLAGSTDPVSAHVIREAISTFTHDKPLDSDVARVSAMLAAEGWPVAKPDRAS